MVDGAKDAEAGALVIVGEGRSEGAVDEGRTGARAGRVGLEGCQVADGDVRRLRAAEARVACDAC